MKQKQLTKGEVIITGLGGAGVLTAGTLLAEAEALLVDLSQERIEAVDLDALGWRVYDE